jgi:hypothetical protein
MSTTNSMRCAGAPLTTMRRTECRLRWRQLLPPKKPKDAGITAPCTRAEIEVEGLWSV